jgi:Sec-independent protein translocase protein TatA
VEFGAEIFFIVALGFLLLGPKRLPAILGHVARAKAQFKHATQSFATELDPVLDIPSHQQRADFQAQPGEEQ